MCIKLPETKNPEKLNYRDKLYLSWLPSTDLNRGPIG